MICFIGYYVFYSLSLKMISEKTTTIHCCFVVTGGDGFCVNYESLNIR